MAKRRKLEAPSAADLDKLEKEFRRETPSGPGMAPIAQVAMESAQNAEVISADQRKAAAELDRYRAAESQGLVAEQILLSDIDISALTRDRLALDPQEFEELKGSIAKNGLRMPIEVYKIPDGAGASYGLISGYRRYLATKDIRGEAGRIECFVRPKEGDARLTEAMVEENEIRSSLTHYERGRICVLSVQNGHDADLEAAVNRLFGFASKAKRSKIRSFARIYEALGDVLRYPDGLKERQGLAISAALKDGYVTQLREALAHANCVSAADEWRVIESLIAQTKKAPVANEPDLQRAGIRNFTSARGVDVRWYDIDGKITIEIDTPIKQKSANALISFMKDNL